MRQAAYANGQKFINLQDFKRFLGAHKILLALACAILLALLSWLVYAHIQNSSKFSRADFDRLSSTAENILLKSDAGPVVKIKSCSYKRPAEFASLHLYCEISMVVYSNYLGENEARVMAQKLKNNAGVLGAVFITNQTAFSTKPENNLVIITVNLNKQYPSDQCSFEVNIGRLAKNLGNGLPKKNEDNLIALTFQCSAESQGEYFPVTYRQGA